MRTTKFSINIVVKIITFVIISFIALVFLGSPIISNELAMTQMENSNALYLMVETYNKVKPVISVIYGCISVLLVGSAICDIYKLYKFINTKENKGEN